MHNESQEKDVTPEYLSYELEAFRARLIVKHNVLPDSPRFDDYMRKARAALCRMCLSAAEEGNGQLRTSVHWVLEHVLGVRNPMDALRLPNGNYLGLIYGQQIRSALELLKRAEDGDENAKEAIASYAKMNPLFHEQYVTRLKLLGAASLMTDD